MMIRTILQYQNSIYDGDDCSYDGDDQETGWSGTASGGTIKIIHDDDDDDDGSYDVDDEWRRETRQSGTTSGGTMTN